MLKYAKKLRKHTFSGGPRNDMWCNVNDLNSFIHVRCNTMRVTIGRKVRFYHTLPFNDETKVQFGCGYLETAPENRNH